MLLNLAGVMAMAAPIAFGFVNVSQARAQAAAAVVTPPQGIADTWQGTLHAGKDLRVVAKISKADGGGLKAVFYSIDQGGQAIPANTVTLEGATVKFAITAISGSFEGKLSADGKTIAGTWTQGPNPLTLNLERATPDTACHS